MTFAALVDFLHTSTRKVSLPPPDEPVEFNSAYICAEELGAFIHKYDNEMIKGLAAFYDPDPYEQHRRGNELRIKIPSPQINLITATTPQDLIALMPEAAWGQGFTSRMIMVFSDEKIVGDDFAIREPAKLDDLAGDLLSIATLYGPFHVTQEYADCINNWRSLGEPPVPNHPKLVHYVTRRRVHLYKLSMVSSVDRGNSFAITREDFNRAMNWLAEAEATMPDIFKAGATNINGQAMDEILHFVIAGDRGTGVDERRITKFAKDRVPIHTILKVIEIMESSGMLRCVQIEKRTGVKFYSANQVIQ